MRVICRKGLTDKTELIEIAVEEGLYIVCKDRETERKIYERAIEMGISKLPNCLTFEEFVRGEFLGVLVKGFVIDDVDLLVEYLARGVPVKVIFINIAGEREIIKKSEVKDFYVLFDVGLKRGRARNAGNT